MSTTNTTERQQADFKAIKSSVTMMMLLKHYGVADLMRKGDELKGDCPIHGASSNPSHKPFAVNLTKNTFKCFSPKCSGGRGGGVLEFVMAMEDCSLREAGLRLHDWFLNSANGQSNGTSPEVVEYEQSSVQLNPIRTPVLTFKTYLAFDMGTGEYVVIRLCAEQKKVEMYPLELLISQISAGN